ncbi:MAG: hypothetical protein GXP49_06685 [Deltaproteobacteria bacterium]|nr:hypothetical protein [Deltaproteobacteria bacterium]
MRKREHAKLLSLLFFIVLSVLTGCYGSGTLCPNGDCFGGPPDAETDGEQAECHQSCGVDYPCCPSQVCAYFVDDPSNGVCISRSREEARTRDDPSSPADDSNVDLTCLESGSASLSQGPDKAYLEGCVDAFGLGFDTRNLNVAVYLMNSDGSLGRELGKTLADEEGYYKIPNQLPTNSMLVAKVWGQGVRDTYKYNMQIPAHLVEDHVFYDNVFVISNSTWDIISAIACQCKIDPGFGVVAGTIRDCSEVTGYVHERPSCARTIEVNGKVKKKLQLEDYAEIKNAMVSLVNAPESLIYFNGNEDDLAPIPVRIGSRDKIGTNDDGTYATLNTSVGTNLVGAAAVIGGTLTSLGAIPIQVFPDAVTIANLVVWGSPKAGK